MTCHTDNGQSDRANSPTNHSSSGFIELELGRPPVPNRSESDECNPDRNGNATQTETLANDRQYFGGNIFATETAEAGIVGAQCQKQSVASKEAIENGDMNSGRVWVELLDAKSAITWRVCEADG